MGDYFNWQDQDDEKREEDPKYELDNVDAQDSEVRWIERLRVQPPLLFLSEAIQRVPEYGNLPPMKHFGCL